MNKKTISFNLTPGSLSIKFVSFLGELTITTGLFVIFMFNSQIKFCIFNLPIFHYSLLYYPLFQFYFTLLIKYEKFQIFCKQIFY